MNLRLLALGAMTYCIFVLCILAEWLFYITKPSFLSGLYIEEKVYLLLRLPLLPGIAFGLLAVLAGSFSSMSKRFLGRDLISPIAVLLPATLMLGLTILLVDNFAYTLFEQSSLSLTGYQRLISMFCAYFLLMSLFVALIRVLQSKRRRLKPYVTAAILFFLVSLITSGVRFFGLTHWPEDLALSLTEPQSRPDIFLIGIDGIETELTSFERTDRDTTPFLKEFADKAHYFENAFSTSGTTVAAIGSLLTSRYPSQTLALMYPDVVYGKESVRSLPAILRLLGYRNFAFGERKFADPYDMNFRHAFHESNQREIGWFENNPLKNYTEIISSPDLYFWKELSERFLSRLFYVLGLVSEETIAPYRLTIWPLEDHEQRAFSAAREFLDRTTQPVFLHIHLLGTHGPYYLPNVHLYSKGQKQHSQNMDDFFDDAVLSADVQLRKFIEYLKQKRRFRDAFIAIYSDHNRNRDLIARVPLLVKLPRQSENVIRTAAVSLIDVAPTILETIGISRPPWMHGVSLLGDESSAPRKLYFADVESAEVAPVNKYPPYYNLHKLGVVHCNRAYTFILPTGEVKQENLPGHESSCQEHENITSEYFFPSPLTATAVNSARH